MLGKPDYGSELEEYRAFAKEFAKVIQGGNALQPTSSAQGRATDPSKCASS